MDVGGPTYDRTVAAPQIEITEEFADALTLLDDGSHLFLTGNAGSGKSTLIRHFLTTTRRNAIVVAPTGVAALNVDGYTIHRLFSFPAGVSPTYAASPGYVPQRFGRALKSLDTLVVDEVSMVRADLFDAMAIALERHVPRPGTPFGGVQLVLVGDLYQLPPVVSDAEESFFSSRYPTPYFFSADHYDPAAFPSVQLTRIFRQAGDQRLVGILNSIRDGSMAAESQAILNARVSSEFTPPADEFWLTLAPTRRIVSARNRAALERLPGEEFVSHARATGDLALLDEPVEREIHYKVGAQIMLLTNDPAGRWVNGSLGRVVGHHRVDGERYVAVQVRGGNVVDVGPHTWEVTRPGVVGGRITHEPIGTYTQLPFQLGWAVTIHKSQGQSLDRLLVDLTGGTFATGQLYVALSRATSYEGLVLKRPVLPRDLKIDHRVKRFLLGAGSGADRWCAVAALMVGEEDGFVRPIEIAFAFDHGVVSTVLNPTRDIGDSAMRFGLDAGEVAVAPTLEKAWPLLAAYLAGSALVGVGVDQLTSAIDVELKRRGITAPPALGVALDPARLTPCEREGLRAGSARERAHAVRRAAERLAAEDEEFAAALAGAHPSPPAPEGAGYLLTRDALGPWPVMPNESDTARLVRVSRIVSATVLDQAGPAGLAGAAGPAHRGVEPYPEFAEADPGHRQARDAAARQIAEVAARIHASDRLAARLARLGAVLGAEIAPAGDRRVPIGDALTPGARVCFTGTASDRRGRTLAREVLESIAVRAGLRAVGNVTKTRCEVLVAADLATQSSKARKAAEWGKPVYSVAEFLSWAGE